MYCSCAYYPSGIIGIVGFCLIVGIIVILKGFSKLYRENEDVRAKWRRRTLRKLYSSPSKRNLYTNPREVKGKKNTIKKKSKHCTKCGTKFAEDSLFCHTCGKSQNTDVRFCQYCGKNRVDDATFCHKCGNLIISLTDMNFKVETREEIKEKDQVKYCNSCGNTRDKNEPYCSNCGILFRHKI